MTEPQIAPYGSWKSPITADLVVAETIRLGEIRLDGQDVYWNEMRPAEGGRNVVVRRSPDGSTADVTPPGFNVRTRVHEYGVGAYTVANGTLYFSNWKDQRLYRQDPGQSPRPITPEVGWRYADGVLDHRRGRMICVREDHTVPGQEAVNTLVSLDLEGDGPPQELVSRHDFYASPRLSPDGARLAWLAWNHPNMPWDGTELWVAGVGAAGSLGQAERVAGGADESIFQPEWSPDGSLYFVSDRTGWWNLYRLRGGRSESVVELEAEFGLPQWVFGMSTYAFESAGSIVCAYSEKGTWQLARLNTERGALAAIDTPYTQITQVRAAPGRVLFLGGSPVEPMSVVHLDLDTGQQATGQTQVLRRSSAVSVDVGYLSQPQAIEFPTERA